MNSDDSTVAIHETEVRFLSPPPSPRKGKAGSSWLCLFPSSFSMYKPEILDWVMIDMLQRFKKFLRNDPKAPKGLMKTATVSASPPSVAAGDLEALRILNANLQSGAENRSYFQRPFSP